MSFLTQMFSVAIFNLRSLPERKAAALTAAIGIAGVVGVLVGVLAIAEGFRRAMTVSGSADVAIVLRSGADSEMTSGLDREATRTIGDAPDTAEGLSYCNQRGYVPMQLAAFRGLALTARG